MFYINDLKIKSIDKETDAVTDEHHRHAGRRFELLQQMLWQHRRRNRIHGISLPAPGSHHHSGCAQGQKRTSTHHSQSIAPNTGAFLQIGRACHSAKAFYSANSATDCPESASAKTRLALQPQLHKQLNKHDRRQSGSGKASLQESHPDATLACASPYKECSHSCPAPPYSPCKEFAYSAWL